ncbi:hypothetical protein GF406_14745 [candidate division KSB1 bacterium]|nr:hypothetical protein [candidate division KSB1 bacterium]
MISLYEKLFATVDWGKKHRTAQKRALEAFRHVYEHSEWYRNTCKTWGNTPENVRDFKAVPILDKKSVFEHHSLEQLLGKNKTPVRFLFPSSGRTGRLSFGVMTTKDVKRATQTTDLFLKLFFHANKQDTLLINCSAMGVRIFTEYSCCDVGSRADLVAGLLKNLSTRWKKIIITTYPNFLKHLVDYCTDSGIDFDSFQIFFVTGGEYFPESLRTYIHTMTQKSFFNNKGYWLSIYGLTEIGYPVFFETPDTAIMRHLDHSGQLDLPQIPGNPFTLAQPFYFNYIPLQLYVENLIANTWSDLVFTHLVKRRIQLIRYNTHDQGLIFQSKDQNNLVGELKKHNIHRRFNFKLLTLIGQTDQYQTFKTQNIFVNDIKELLYQNHAIARAITGYFYLNKDNKTHLFVQLRKNKTLKPNLIKSLQNTLDDHYPGAIQLKTVAFHKMTEQMELDFERKFDHIPTGQQTDKETGNHDCDKVLFSGSSNRK